MIGCPPPQGFHSPQYLRVQPTALSAPPESDLVEMMMDPIDDTLSGSQQDSVSSPSPGGVAAGTKVVREAAHRCGAAIRPVPNPHLSPAQVTADVSHALSA